MKLWFSITATLLTLILFLSACKKNETEFILNEFRGNVSFYAEGSEYKGDFILKNKDEIYFTVSTPEAIKGCEFSFKNGETTLSYDGIIISLQDTSPVKQLFEAVEIMAENPHRITHNGNVTFTEQTEMNRFEGVVDTKEMKLRTIRTGDTVYIFS